MERLKTPKHFGRLGLVAALAVHCAVDSRQGVGVARAQAEGGAGSAAQPPNAPMNDPKPKPGTHFETLVRTYSDSIAPLPSQDGDDPIDLPLWFRKCLRAKLPGLPEKGRPQYPRQSVELLRWLVENQSFDPHEFERRVQGLQPAVAAVTQENQRRAKYPKEWECNVRKGTKLDILRKAMEEEFSILPPADVEDTTPLPIWFRVYLRKQFSDLPTSGPYQYPRTANRILQRLLDNPDSDELDKKKSGPGN
jgi:hypothetical protein